MKSKAAKATTVDHVIPLSRGGLHVIENCVGACAACNSSKKNKLLSEWVRPWPPRLKSA